MTQDKWILCWFDAVLVDLGINDGMFLADKLNIKGTTFFKTEWSKK